MPLLLAGLLTACGPLPFASPNSTPTVPPASATPAIVATVAAVGLNLPTATLPPPPTIPPTRPPTLVPTASVPGRRVGWVTRVLNGDTIQVRLGEEELLVHYLGVEAPERVLPGGPWERFADEAWAENRRLVEARWVELEADPAGPVACSGAQRYVYQGDTFVNHAILRGGFGRLARFPADFQRREELNRAAEEARRRGRGLWAAERTPTPLPAGTPTITPTPIPPEAWPVHWSLRLADLPPGYERAGDWLGKNRPLATTDWAEEDEELAAALTGAGYVVGYNAFFEKCRDTKHPEEGRTILEIEHRVALFRSSEGAAAVLPIETLSQIRRRAEGHFGSPGDGGPRPLPLEIPPIGDAWLAYHASGQNLADGEQLTIVVIGFQRGPALVTLTTIAPSGAVTLDASLALARSSRARLP